VCNNTFACLNHTCVYLSHTCECEYDTRTCRNHILRLKSHSACRNNTLRTEITLVRVEITLGRVFWKIEHVSAKIYLKIRHACEWISHANVSFSHVCVSNFFGLTRNLLLCILYFFAAKLYTELIYVSTETTRSTEFSRSSKVQTINLFCEKFSCMDKPWKLNVKLKLHILIVILLHKLLSEMLLNEQ
jgi:hypothetical protein